MPNQILDFSRSPVRLRTSLKQLRIESENLPIQTIPFEEIAVILVSHPQVTFSQAVLESIADNGGILIACNRKSLPVGMFVPLSGHHLPVQRLQLQITASLPQIKKAWQQIVQAKIQSQGNLLQLLFGDDAGLLLMSQKVYSGDKGNLEAQAAKKYWKRLFAGHHFTRRPDGDDPVNLRLNFGYGVLRGIIARAICATGFNPMIGLHHHNKYNSYCLVDDLMEPFRPIVDRVVFQQIKAKKILSPELTTDIKEEIITPLLGRFDLNGELRTLFDIAGHLATSLVQFFSKERNTLEIPRSFVPHIEDPPF